MLLQILMVVFVLLVIAAIGPSSTNAVWIQNAMANRAALPFTLRTIKWINDFISIPAIGLLVIVGIWLVSTAGLSLSQPWILLSLISWLAVFLLALFGYRPTLARQIAVAESDDPNKEEYDFVAWRSTIIGIIIGVFALVAIFLMVFQPALWG